MTETAQDEVITKQCEVITWCVLHLMASVLYKACSESQTVQECASLAFKPRPISTYFLFS